MAGGPLAGGGWRPLGGEEGGEGSREGAKARRGSGSGKADRIVRATLGEKERIEMGWRALSEGDLLARLGGVEMAALRESALAEGQGDPLPEVLAQVTEEARGYVAAWGGNRLGPPGTLPPQAISAAVGVARWRLAGRLGVGRAGGISQGESRRKEYEDAMEQFREMAGGKLVVELPEVDGPEEMAGDGTVFGGDARVVF